MAGPLWAAAEDFPPPTPPEGDYQALLLTYGPGDVYWERFGHNAIWLRESARDLDHSFNFGFFDFEQPGFLRRFVQGRMLYFAAAMPAEREQAYYRSEGRSVRVQALNLDPLQFARLRDSLLRQVRPENRDYLYDYYLDNCSTRLRDALDEALDGMLHDQFAAQPGVQTFRDHTRRATERDFWYYLGLETGLGAPVDRPISRWDEMFIPEALADSLVEVTRLGARGLEPLVASDTMAFEGSVPAAAVIPASVWPRYLALGLVVVLVGWLVTRVAPAAFGERLVAAWFLLASVAGLALLALMLFTDHAASRPNVNLLLLNPLFLIVVSARWWPMARRLVAALALLGLAAAVAIAAWPGLQYTADVVAALGPVSACAAWWLWRRGAGMRDRGGPEGAVPAQGRSGRANNSR